jgi:hypothetical protein
MRSVERYQGRKVPHYDGINSFCQSSVQSIERSAGGGGEGAGAFH